MAAVFRFLRKRGWTRAAIAAATGLSETRVRQVAQGRQQVTSYDVLVRIADGLLLPKGWMGLGQEDGIEPASFPRGPISGSADQQSPAASLSLPPGVDSSGVGGVVRRHRAELGLSHRQFADLLRILPSQLMEIETGEAAVQDLELLARLSEALSIPTRGLGLSDDLHDLAAAGHPDQSSTAFDDSPPLGDRSMMVDAVTANQRQWQDTRRYLNRHRPELGRRAVTLYPDDIRIGPTSLIARQGWLPERPVDLDRVCLGWRADVGPVRVRGDEPEAWPMLPLRAPGRRYDRYTSAVRYVDPPALFENRPSYRLLDVSWGLGDGRMTFGLATYFDKLDICEALGHEYAMSTMAAREPSATPTWPQPSFRSLIGDPFNLVDRAVVPAVTTLTIRVDEGQPRFLLHWRDPTKVATAGGMYDVIPAGEFQPSSLAGWDRANDFDLWRNIVRELSEELLGAPEHDGSRGEPIDYGRWPMYQALQAARADGRLSAVCLGVGLDALTLAATILTVIVIDGRVFDDIFHDVVQVNAEGLTITSHDPTRVASGIPLTHRTVAKLLSSGPLASPGAACLHLAWIHRKELLEERADTADTFVPMAVDREGEPGCLGRTPAAWLTTRRYLQERRGELTSEVTTLYPGIPRVEGTALLTRSGWIYPEPMPLEDITLFLAAGSTNQPAAHSQIEAADHLLPIVDGTASYAATVEALERPRMLEDRPTYQLVATDLAASPPAMTFGLGTYFDVLNIGEAAAHEYAEHYRAGRRPALSQLPLRDRLGDPTDLTRHPALTAITTLTIRNRRHDEEPRFLVHWRDPAKVATNGGMYQLAPVGMFQPAGTATDRTTIDLDLWRCMVRELSEELLGAPEHENPEYEQWPFFLDLEAARKDGTCRAYLLGIGVDPLTFATDLLTAVVFEQAAFDRIFADIVADNAEGRLDLVGVDGLLGTPFTRGEVQRLADLQRMQPAGAATLRLAWRYRRTLLAF